MKTRTSSALIASFLLLVSLAIPLRADVVPLTWVGDGDGNSLTNPNNWSPTATFANDGSDVVAFGDVGLNFSSVYVSGGLAKLQDVTFSNNTSIYTVSGNFETSELLLNGNLTTSGTANISFNDSLFISLSNTNHTFNIGSGNTVTVGSSISDYAGASSITKDGSGILVLSGNNTFSGGVTVNSGSLILGSTVDGPVGDWGHGPVGRGTLTLNGGAILAPIVDVTLNNSITLGGGTVKLGDCDTESAITFYGTITGTGAFDVHGFGNVTFNGDNSGWSGGVTFLGDNYIYVNHANGLGTGPVAFATYNNESTLFLNTSVSINGLSGGNYSDGGNEIVLDSAVRLTVNQATDSQYTGAINGHLSTGVEDPSDDGLRKTGAGTLTLNGPTSYYGETAIDEGTLADGSSFSFSPNSTFAVTGGTNLTVNYNENIGGLKDGEGAGTVTLGSGANLTVSNILPNTFNGGITGAGSFTKAGIGTLTLTGNNTFTGDLYVGGGTLNLGNAAATYATVGLGSSAVVNFLGTTPTIGGLEADSGSDTVNLLAGTTLTINQTENTDFKGQILAGGAGVNITKAGPGTLTFSHANTYDGATTISGGTLVYGATGAFGTTSAVVINGGTLKIANGATFSSPLTLTAGTLAGNYTFTTPQTFGAGVTLSPGNSPGTMNFTDLTLTGGSAAIEINAATDDPGTSADFFIGTGTLDLSGVGTHGYTLNLISLTPGNTAGPVSSLSGSAFWKLYEFTTITGFVPDGSQFNLDTSQFVNGGTFSLTLTGLAGDGQDLVLNFTPVPEPSTYALMALGLMGTGLAAWRKRRQA